MGVDLEIAVFLYEFAIKSHTIRPKNLGNPIYRIARRRKVILEGVC